VCRQQLADYQLRLAELGEQGVDVVAASSDSEDNARATVEETKASFAVAWGLEPRAFAQATGAFWNERANHLHATSFIVRPGGKIALAVYSTGSLGRLMPQDVLHLMPFLKPKAPPRS
jgi:peroxiredoxin